jgi:Caspase domain
MSRFVSSSFRSWLACAGLVAALFGFAQGAALAQTRTAELDRIQAPPQALPAAEQRVALVIGNSKYQNTEPLANPDNDAQSVAELLNAAGFEVIAATDLSQNDMIKVVQDFSAKIAERGPDTVAMVYYAGHGVQVAGENYLIPVDAKITSPTDLVDHSLRLVDVMATLESIPSRLRIVMLDSCRTNPFPNIVDDGRGLAIVDAPLHSIVGYSTSPGAEALDGANGHSPYTQAFLTLAREPNLPIEQLFKRIRLHVNYATRGLQTPWESSSATSDFYFFGDTAVASSRSPENGPVVQMASDMPWRSVDQVYDYVLSEGSPAYYQEFIDRFPYDPRSDRFRHLLLDLTEAAAWHKAVLANSPLAYKNFYDHHVDGPYAKVALHLESQPKGTALMQAGHLFKGNAGLRQMQLSTGAKVTTLSVHGVNAPGSGKVVNLPANNKGVEHHEIEHHEAEHREIEHHESEHHDAGHHEIGHNGTDSRPHEHFERRQTSFNHFSNSQAHMNGMGGMRGGGGMHMMGGGGGFGRRH